MILAAGVLIYWFVLPLIVAISLVYAASRSDSWRAIRAGSLRLALTILGILAATTVVLLLINTRV